MISKNRSKLQFLLVCTLTQVKPKSIKIQTFHRNSDEDNNIYSELSLSRDCFTQYIHGSGNFYGDELILSQYLPLQLGVH